MELRGRVEEGWQNESSKLSLAAKIIEAQERYLNDKCLETWSGNISYEK